jgi:hypothetical protein
MNAHERIDGAERLTRVFGSWPSFHDAEVLWVRLDRRPFDEVDDGPGVEALIHTFEMTSEVGPGGYYVLRHHSLVLFRFHDVDELDLGGFNHQNVLFGLSIADVRECQIERINFEVTLESSYGLSGSFLCRRVEVKEVTPCTEDAAPL